MPFCEQCGEKIGPPPTGPTCRKCGAQLYNFKTKEQREHDEKVGNKYQKYCFKCGTKYFGTTQNCSKCNFKDIMLTFSLIAIGLVVLSSIFILFYNYTTVPRFYPNQDGICDVFDCEKHASYILKTQNGFGFFGEFCNDHAIKIAAGRDLEGGPITAVQKYQDSVILPRFYIGILFSLCLSGIIVYKWRKKIIE